MVVRFYCEISMEAYFAVATVFASPAFCTIVSLCWPLLYLHTECNIIFLKILFPSLMGSDFFVLTFKSSTCPGDLYTKLVSPQQRMSLWIQCVFFFIGHCVATNLLFFLSNLKLLMYPLSNMKIKYCRTVTVGSQIYLSGTNVIRILQVSWHPCSDTHLGILSSDSVFRYQILFYSYSQDSFIL